MDASYDKLESRARAVENKSSLSVHESYRNILFSIPANIFIQSKRKIRRPLYTHKRNIVVCVHDR